MNFSELVQTFDSKRWRKLGRWKKSLMLDWIEATSLGREQFREIGLNWQIDNYAFVDHTAMMGEDDFAATKRFYEQNLTGDYSFAFKHGERCYQTGNRLLEFSRTLVSKPHWPGTGLIELIDQFEKFVSLVAQNIPFFPPLIPLEEVLDERVRMLLVTHLNNRGISEIQLFDYLNSLSAPKRQPDMIAKGEALLRIGERIQSDKSTEELFLHEDGFSIAKKLPGLRQDLSSSIHNYVNRYGWLNTFGWVGIPFNEVDTIEELKQIVQTDCAAQIKKLAESRETTEKNIQSELHELNASQELRNVIDVIREYAYLRVFRIDIYNKAFFEAGGLFEEVSRRLNLPVKHLLLLTPAEVHKTLGSRDSVSPDLIRDRLRGFTILRLDGELTLLTGDHYESFEQSRRKEEYGHLTEVTGDPIFKGNAEGPAKVTMDASELTKVNRGDILIAPMTNPDFTAVFGKIAGIITDEGGVLCHAAIIAREYELPCIISTKIATKVFRDDDFVVLNAHNGTAKKTNKLSQLSTEIDQGPPKQVSLKVTGRQMGNSEKIIHWLEDDNSLPEVGSKFHNLATLHQHNFRVPYAFCVGTSAFKHFINENQLTQTINNALNEMEFHSGDNVKRLAGEIRLLIRTGDLPTSTWNAISQALSKLKPVSVSVRSSSASEDLASASFAGVYDSFLNVNGLEEIARKIKDCWASLFSERCLYYFAQQVKQGRIATPELSIAVIVQELINSEKSGICFTANPETSRVDQVVIQAAYGLGEGVVSGQIASDVYVTDKMTEQIVTQNIAEKHAAVVPDSSGGVREIIIDQTSDRVSVLSADEAAELTRLSISIETVFNTPQDIEWAKDAERGFFVLQSRPITTGASNLR